MKKSIVRFLSVAVCILCFLNDSVETQAAAGTMESSIAASYLDKIAQLEKSHGKYSIKQYPYGVPGEDWKYASGLSYISLIDFDKDGTKELYAVWRDRKKEEFRFGIFSYRKGKCIKLGQAQVSCGGSPIIFWTEISKKGLVGKCVDFIEFVI